LAASDVTVIPRPDIPGYPLKLLNAMAAGKPIVCFAGAAKGVAHLREAFVVPDHDVDAMGRGIVTLLRDRELAEHLGANARQTILQEFDWEILCTEIQDVYRRVLGPAHPTRASQAEGFAQKPAQIASDADA
jgi:glycosyltransferase involved in cell wall biosynthesis